MTKDTDEILGATTGAAVTAGLATAVGPFASRFAGSLAGHAVKRLFGLARTTLAKRDLRKFESWLQEIAATNEYASAEDTLKLIEERIDEPWAHGPLEDAVRAIRDGIDEAALVYLAKLAAWQIRDQAPPNRWSRRAVALLLDCDAPMIEVLKVFAGELSASLQPPHDPGGGLILTADYPREDPSEDHLLKPAHPLSAELYSLLRSHQFGADSETGGAVQGEETIHIRPAEMRYLVRLFS